MKETHKYGYDKENSKVEKLDGDEIAADYTTQKSVNFEKDSRATHDANLGPERKLGQSLEANSMKGTGDNFHNKVLSPNKKYNATDKKLVSDPFSLNKNTRNELNISNAKSNLEEHPNSVNRKTVMFKQNENESMLNRSR